jgi:hypothetical protein
MVKQIENYDFYIAERGTRLSDIKIVGRCKNLKSAVIVRDMNKEQEENIDFFILQEVEE